MCPVNEPDCSIGPPAGGRPLRGPAWPAENAPPPYTVPCGRWRRAHSSYCPGAPEVGAAAGGGGAHNGDGLAGGAGPTGGAGLTGGSSGPADRPDGNADGGHAGRPGLATFSAMVGGAGGNGGAGAGPGEIGRASCRE